MQNTLIFCHFFRTCTEIDSDDELETDITTDRVKVISDDDPVWLSTKIKEAIVGDDRTAEVAPKVFQKRRATVIADCVNCVAVFTTDCVETGNNSNDLIIDESADAEVETALALAVVKTSAEEDPDFVLPLKKKRKRNIVISHDDTTDEESDVATVESGNEVRPERERLVITCDRIGRSVSLASTRLPDYSEVEKCESPSILNSFKSMKVDTLFPYVPEDYIYHKQLTKKKSIFTMKDFYDCENPYLDSYLGRDSYQLSSMEYNYFNNKDDNLYNMRVRSRSDWFEMVSRPIYEAMRTPSGRQYLETVMQDYVKAYVRQPYDASTYKKNSIFLLCFLKLLL